MKLDEGNAPAAGAELGPLRAEITNLVARNAIAMVQSVIDAVQNGQYQGLKYLFEMVGLYPAAAGETEPGESSLAETILRQLGIHEPATQRCLTATNETAHPVK